MKQADAPQQTSKKRTQPDAPATAKRPASVAIAQRELSQTRVTTKTPDTMNQREQVKVLYQEPTGAPKASSNDVENARNQVKSLYEETTLEETQRIRGEPANSRSAISPEQQRVKEELKLLGAMARDKAEAQAARMERGRATIRDRIHLQTQRKYHEHFEAHALAQEMIAMKDRNLDRQEGQMKEAKAMLNAARGDVQMDKAKATQATEMFQARTRKHEAAVAKRLDIITPGSFEQPQTDATREKPTVRINRNMRQDHQIDVDPRQEFAAQSLQRTEQARNEATVRFNETLEDRSVSASPSTESVQEALASLKAKAEENGLVTLNSKAQAERVAEDVRAETRQSPEQAIQSQSQVSLQAALKVLQ